MKRCASPDTASGKRVHCDREFDVYQKAIELLGTGDTQLAIDLLLKDPTMDGAAELLGNAYLELGNRTEAVKWLSSVKDSDSAVCTLALIDIQSGMSQKADDVLRTQGFRWRLSDDVLRGTGCISDEPGPWVVVDKLIPEAMMGALRAGFSPESSYWSANNYDDPSTDYFSYRYELHTPKLVVEQLIQTYLLPMVKSKFGVEPVMAEWWAHRRAPTSGHQLHFDTDEAGMSAAQEIKFPLVSTVLYVDVGSAAPTMVSTQVFQQGVSETVNGCLVSPVEGRVLMFDGKLLHGVVPSLTKAPVNTQRLTIMVGFWGETLVESELSSASMCVPSSADWVSSMPCIDAPASTPDMLDVAPTIVKQVWKKLSSSTDPSNASYMGKYFLSNEHEIDTDLQLNSDSHTNIYAKSLLLELCSYGEDMDTALAAADLLVELAGDSSLSRNVFRAGVSGQLAEFSVIVKPETPADVFEAAACILWNLAEHGMNGMYLEHFDLMDPLINAITTFDEEPGILFALCGLLSHFISLPRVKTALNQSRLAAAVTSEIEEEDDETLNMLKRLSVLSNWQ